MNSSDINTRPAPGSSFQQPVHNGYSIAQILNIVQCGLGGLILITNFLFLAVLAFGRWRLQRPKRYALSANLALADVISGLVLMALSIVVLFDWYSGTMMYMLLETVMSANFAMCTLCYDAILRIQYVAVNRPIRYFLYLTTSRLFAIVVLIWTIAHAYAFGKGYVLFFQSTKYIYALAICEVAVMGVGWLINFFAYIFVLRIACKKAKARHVQVCKDQNRQAAVNLLKNQIQEATDEEESDPRFCGTPQSEYAFLVTVGLNLFIFFVSFGPLWVSWVMAVCREEEVYFEQRSMVTRHLLLLVCFVRGVFEPIVHLLRQPKLVCGSQYGDIRD